MLQNPLGAFYSIAGGGYKGAFESAVADGATALHMFGKSPRSGKLKGEFKSEAAEALAYFKTSPLTYGVLHASYLLNFAKKQPRDSYQFQLLEEDLAIASACGLNGVVLHMGKTVGQDPAVARENFEKQIASILPTAEKLKVDLILENTAGQGTEIGFAFEDYGTIFKNILKHHRSKHLKACLDTEHSFAAGYDWTNEKSASEALDLFDKTVGLEHLACAHFNDSKNPCGSRLDRHADIDRGEIGKKGLKNFIELLNKKTGGFIPLLLETPAESPSYQYKQQMQEIRSWF
ncbi:MAG: deoxyribonuclease IV [Candidatus Paceibacterota bacterium]|jgi:deoxyribonuclease-4